MPLDGDESETTGCKFDAQDSNGLGDETKRLSDAAARSGFAGKVAKKLDEQRYVYAVYGLLDGLNLSYSSLKYFFDLVCLNLGGTSSDVMHDWMVSPAGIAVAAIESVGLVVFGMLANYLNDNDKNLFKRYLVTIWPYCRDTLKGLKNTYKGLRSLASMVDLLGGQNFNFMLLPLSLGLGILSIANRLWHRRMVSERKQMMKENAALLEKVKQHKGPFTEKTANDYRLEIRAQATRLRYTALGSAAYRGVIDGLYLYLGVFTLCPLTWPIFVAVSAFSLLYSTLSIAAYAYEERDYQRKLEIIQVKIELELSKQLLITQLHELKKQLSHRAPRTEEAALELQQLIKKITDSKVGLNAEFRQRLEEANKKIKLSHGSAFFAGLKNGLSAYGVVAGVLFALGIIFLLASVAFPPALLATGVFLGAVCLIGFTLQSMIQNYRHQKEQHEKQREEFAKLQEEVNSLKLEISEVVEEPIPPSLFERLEADGLVIDPSPQYLFQEWSEIFRSFFSGVGKGSKSVDYTLNPFLEADANGHYHEASNLMIVAGVFSLIYSIGLALRAFARGFGRAPLVNETKAPKSQAPSSVLSSTMDTPPSASPSPSDTSPSTRVPTPIPFVIPQQNVPVAEEGRDVNVVLKSEHTVLNELVSRTLADAIAEVEAEANVAIEEEQSIALPKLAQPIVTPSLNDLAIECGSNPPAPLPKKALSFVPVAANKSAFFSKSTSPIVARQVGDSASTLSPAKPLVTTKFSTYIERIPQLLKSSRHSVETKKKTELSLSAYFSSYENIGPLFGGAPAVENPNLMPFSVEEHIIGSSFAGVI